MKLLSVQRSIRQAMQCGDKRQGERVMEKTRRGQLCEVSLPRVLLWDVWFMAGAGKD